MIGLVTLHCHSVQVRHGPSGYNCGRIFFPGLLTRPPRSCATPARPVSRTPTAAELADIFGQLNTMVGPFQY
jgi:hypothetical protein